VIRARFETNASDPRPVNWPIKHPYWITGAHGIDWEIFTIVAYADDVDEIKRNWPEAVNIDATPADDYVFTDRFPKPDWFKK